MTEKLSDRQEFLRGRPVMLVDCRTNAICGRFSSQEEAEAYLRSKGWGPAAYWRTGENKVSFRGIN